ncbi:tripartite tricarboxylate transporter substrate binding protein [Aquincola sp. MAHUQ-54]|uniref:Tripartite tricarboxylate transporter substrate binding protein n=1 Tax=Aquincola agrisoli TaxID=3119538 RepID=A0AAW9QFT6_9BURK
MHTAFPTRRHTLACIAAAAAALLAAATPATAQPEGRPVTLLVGFPPGGGVDIVARQLAEKLQRQTGRTFIVENKPGAGGNLAMETVARAPADGLTLLMGNLGMLSVNPALYPKLSVDPSRDLVPVSRLVVTPLVAIVPPGNGGRTVQDVLQQARKSDGFMFASGGNGNINHLAPQLFSMQAQVPMTHVPYKGSAAALTDLSAGRVHLMIDAGNVVQGFVKDGRARAVFTTGEKRSTGYDVPTAREAGFPDMVIYGWQGVLAPAGTPPAVVEKWSQEIGRALADPVLAAKLSEQGTEPNHLGPAAFKTFVEAERKRWTGVVKAANITLE